MLKTKDYGILLDIVKRSKRIEDKIKNASENEFQLNEDLVEVVCFNFIQIGELAKKLSEDFTHQYSEVPWKQIKGMRDRVAHGYDSIDYKTVWNTAVDDVKSLRTYCETIIKNN